MGFDLASIFGKTAGEVVEKIGGIADEFITTKAEKEEFKLKAEEALRNATFKAQEQVQAELDSYLKDTQNARDNNARIQESDKASWMSKNIAYIIDIILTLVWSIFTIYIMGKAVKLISDNADMTGVLSLYATVTAVFMTVLNFHRGSSRGSEKSGDVMRQIAKGVNS